jgi:hypothetical protein
MLIPHTLLTRVALIALVALAQPLRTVTLAEEEQAAAPAHHAPPVQTDSGVSAIRRAMAGLTSPEFEQRKRNRRLLQQRGYVLMLQEVIRHDGLSALFSYLRMRAQLDFHLPQNTLMVFVPILYTPPPGPHMPPVTGAPSPPMGFPLVEDRSFPTDPWK